ncbi:hypothetical protein, partial [Pseudoalteromonas sp. S1688]|uniref:hypothetical protein n=1 Tax=Pseudoalteromonas sp. S1688 TaxID=579511 RepID=UPI001271817A
HGRLDPPNYPTSSDGASELSNIVGWRLWLIQPTLIVGNVGRLSGEAAPPDIEGNTRHQATLNLKKHSKKKRSRSKLP